MAVGVVPVQAAAAVFGVDLAGLLVERVGPEVQPAGLDAAEDLVELGLSDQEGVVGRDGVAVVVGEVEAHVVGRLEHQERAVGRGLWQAEDVGEEAGGLLLVADPDDGVVELDGHGYSWWARRAWIRSSRAGLGPVRACAGCW